MGNPRPNRDDLGKVPGPTGSDPDQGHAGPRGAAAPDDLTKIGVVAASAGVSERTLRYYEEIGLICPAVHRPGGIRLYGPADIERIRRIRDLQRLMGFNLEEIREVVSAEDRLEALRDRYHDSEDRSDQRAVLEEAAQALDYLRTQVKAKLEQLQAFLGELDARAERHLRRLASWESGPERVGESATR